MTLRSKPFLLLLLLLGPLAAAPAQAAKQRLVHDYQFKRNLNDSRRGAALVSLGGTVGNRIYTFDAGQGLQLDATGVTDHYAIEIRFRLDLVDDYRKVLDFKNLGSDNGLYVFNGALNFYDFVTDGSIAAGQLVTVLLERDGTTGLVRGFINNRQVWEFTDTGGDAIFDAQKAFFFVDEPVTTTEHSAGAVTRIRIWDRPKKRR
jgi:hypothetical protein